MDDRKKKILIGIIILAVAAIIGWLLYSIAVSPPAPPPVAEVPPEEKAPPRPRPGLPAARPGVPGVPITPAPPAPPGEEAPPEIPPEEVAPPPPPASPIATGGLTTVTTLTDARVASPARAPNGRDLAYYNRDDGKFYRITPDGKTTPLSDQVFRDIERIAWAPDTNRAVLEFPDSSNILYDFAAEKQVTLPKHWTEFSFAPQGDALAFKSMDLDPNDRWLAIASPDGSGAQPIEPLGNNAHKVTVNWSPNQSMVATFVQSRDAIRQEVVFLGKNQENFRLATVEGRQFVGQWTPKGDRMLYSAAAPHNGYRPMLWIVDAAPGTSGENRQSLNLATFADKCTFATDNTTAYCAVPTTLPEGGGLVREVVATIPDAFYRVDTTTGAQTFLATPAGDPVAATNLVVSEDGRNLFFTDMITGTLKKVQLK